MVNNVSNLDQPDGASIVIVDDNPDNLEVLEGLLQSAGYKVRPALSGEVALRAIELNPPDLVLLDIRMPQMNGYETCLRLKADPRLCDIPVIFVSALSDTDDKLKAFEVGGVDYVTKPFERAEVLARVKAHVQLRRMQVHLESLVESRTAELRVAYETVAARERQFRTLAENQPDYISRYDREGRKVYINSALVQAFGPDAASYLGRRYDEIGEAYVSKEYVAAVRRALTQGEDAEIRMSVPSPSGQLLTYSVRMAVERDERGDISGVLAVARDITRILETERRLEELSIQLRQLAARQEAAREEERRSIGREVHDELGQQLTALRLRANLIKLQHAGSEPTLKAAIAELVNMVDSIIRVARDVSTALRPAVLDMGISPALEWLASEFRRNAGLRCEVDPIPMTLRANEKQAVILFRVAQESLTNAARHANANRVRISLREADDNYVLEVRDDGTGFDSSATQPGKFGLIGMRERVLSVGGKLDVESAVGRGTRVRATIPVVRGEAEADS